MAAIEEDFRSTRKIARAGVTGRGAVQRALLPILPLAARPVLPVESPEQLVLARLTPDERAFFSAIRASIVDQTAASRAGDV